MGIQARAFCQGKLQCRASTTPSCFELGHFCHRQKKCSMLSNTLLFRDRVQRGRQEASEARPWHQDCVSWHKDPKGWFTFPEADALETIPRPDLQAELSICILWFTHLLLNLNAEQTKQEGWEVPQSMRWRKRRRDLPQPRSMAGVLNLALAALPWQLLQHLEIKG